MAFHTHAEVSLRQSMPGACNDETMTGAMKSDKPINQRQWNEILLQ